MFRFIKDKLLEDSPESWRHHLDLASGRKFAAQDKRILDQALEDDEHLAE
jgi:hypothetical protein